MASKAFAPVGLKLGVTQTVATPMVYSYVKEVTSLNGPTQTKETIDTTSMDTTDGYRTFIAGFKDGGEISGEANFTSESFQDMQDLFADSDAGYFIIELPNDEGTHITFTGLVTANQMSASVGEKMSASFTIKLSGGITIVDTVVPSTT